MTAAAHRTSHWYRPMSGRSPGEPHRVATPLELFFDLVFVVAVAQAAGRLHHAALEGHALDTLAGYAMAFFGIWWAWMNFTWFASAYDTDDIPFRIAVFVQITGALIIAAGVPSAVDHRDMAVFTAGYVVMRLAGTAQWLRAAREDPEHRVTCLRYAAGVVVVQIGWVVRLFLPGLWGTLSNPVLVVCELLVPIVAERGGMTSWHPHHIAERYGLFTLIVLGESVAAATTAVQGAIDAHVGFADLATTAVGGLLVVFSMWWLYFSKPAHGLLTSLPRAILWGYGHYLVFASAAAVGAGLAVAVDHAAGGEHVEVTARAAGAMVTVPVAVFLLTVWALHLQPHRAGPWLTVLPPAAAVLVLALTATGQPVLLAGIVMAALVALGTATVPHPDSGAAAS